MKCLIILAALGLAWAAAIRDAAPAAAQSTVRLPPPSQPIGQIRRGRDGQIELAPGSRAGPRRSPRDHPSETEPSPGLEPAGESGWIADPRTGCQVWNTDPRPGESITWSGACANGRATGRGVLQWFENGRPTVRAEGEYGDGQSLGRGTFEWPDGARYAGEFGDTGWHGRGIFAWADGERYEGDWRDGEQDGRGVYSWADGGRYEGEWRGGRRHGQGVQVWAGGGRYEGQWSEDVPHGQGTLTGRQGTYSGSWTEGCFRDGTRRAAVGADVTLATCP